MSNNEHDIPRWQQGLRPGVYGDVWDAMKPSERRRTFVGDIATAVIGLVLLCLLFR